MFFGGGMPGFFSGGNDDEMPGMGGMPGMPGRANKEVDNNRYYELLGVTKDVTQKEITKGFRKIAMKAHPDKGGDPEKFKEINEAYQVQSDEKKRGMYDKYGEEGQKEGPGMGGMEDIFSMFGGGGGPRMQQQGAKKTKPVMKEVQVKLEDVFQGKVVKLPLKKRVCCENCDGKGAKNVKTCSECKGQGFKIKSQMIGPGMIQQSQVPCGTCRGEGKSFDEKDRCTVCKGDRIKDVEKVLEVPIEKGVPDQKDILFAGEGNEVPGAMAGDLHVIVSIKAHPIFIRKGADLYMKKKISLIEALAGVNFKQKHQDESHIIICSAPADVITNKGLKVIQGKGMPFYGDIMSFGNLIIEFEVEFPKPGSIKKSGQEELKKLLPGPKIIAAPEEYEMQEDYHDTMRNENAEGGHKGKDENEEDGRPQGQQVECGNQ